MFDDFEVKSHLTLCYTVAQQYLTVLKNATNANKQVIFLYICRLLVPCLYFLLVSGRAASAGKANIDLATACRHSATS